MLEVESLWPGMELGLRVRGQKYKIFFETPNKHLFRREMLCLQYFYYIFTTNRKWKVIIGCYEWAKM